MLGKSEQRKHGTTRGLPTRSRMVKATRMAGSAGKSHRVSGEWGGWGRIGDDEPEQNTPDRSEGPWGRAAKAARMVVSRQDPRDSPLEVPPRGHWIWNRHARRA